MDSDFKSECYNGKSYPSSNDLFPAADACKAAIAATTCTLKDFPKLPDHLTTDQDLNVENIQPNDQIKISCGKTITLMSKAIDLNGDGAWTLTCKGGKLQDEAGSSSWSLPSWLECQTVCKNIQIPNDNGYEEIESVVTVAEEQLVLKCKNENDRMNSDWSDQFAINCHNNGTFDKIKTWPKCQEPPTCGLPPIPSPVTGLMQVGPRKSLVASQKATYTCKNGAFVLQESKTVEITCEPTEDGKAAKYRIPGEESFLAALYQIDYSDFYKNNITA